MKFTEFKDKVQEEYRKILPESMCKTYIFKCLGKRVYIDCFIAGNNRELPNGIEANDMLNISFSFALPDNFNEGVDALPDALVMEVMKKCYRIKTESPYLYCDYHNMSYRKTRGNAEKIVKTLERYFSSLRSSLEDDLMAGNIHNNDINLLRGKLV